MEPRGAPEPWWLLTAMKVSVELPDSMVDMDARFLKEALVATLYHLGRLSERQAREALGMTRRAFGEMLPRFGFSTLIDSRANLDIELSA